MKDFKCIYKSTELPEEWDRLANNYFQQTKFLNHAEKYNPCQQRYYLCFLDGKLASAAIVYSLRLDILTYINIKSPLKMNIVGVPCSVSSHGFLGEMDSIKVLKSHIYKVEKGLVLMLNLEEQASENSGAVGKTLPTILISNHHSDWNNYLASLRSNYRRRLKLINQENKQLRFEKIPCSTFTEKMYKQYLEVYNRSSGKLEKLSADFFRNLPPEFILTVCYLNDLLVGWNIALENNKMYYFFLGGIDYKQNRTHGIYLRLLSQLIRDGVERKAAFIELGQTAEIAKMRMGGKSKTLYMEAHHSNVILNKLLKLGSPMLEYKRKLENTNAIKAETL
jgi:hypothetical protein